MTPEVRLRLVDMEAEPENVELPDGTVAKVKRLDGVVAGLWFDWTNSPNAERDPRILWQIAGLCLPGIDKEIVEGLSAPQAGAVIAVASGNVEKALAAIQGGMRVEDLPALACDPTIQSAPQSSPSLVPPDGPQGASP